jgi:hypothetical protein
MQTCPSCGGENPAGARFCHACGTELAASAAREVRKTVTVLFADVTGSTALGERLDPESFRRVMARYFDAARTCLERHGGTVEKFIGDAVMAVFGVPTVHEDDALRALRAASDLRNSLASLNDELERDFGVSLQLRTGVNTGEVVSRRPPYRRPFDCTRRRATSPPLRRSRPRRQSPRLRSPCWERRPVCLSAGREPRQAWIPGSLC